MRVAFLGNARWSVPTLEALADSGHELAAVLTRSPRPGGRGNRPIATPVADAALQSGLPLVEVDTVKSGRGFDALVGSRPDVLVVVAYGEILPAGVLAVPRVAPVNVHFSLLPQLRGAAPVQRAILAGLERTGVTVIRMEEGMDTGPILRRAEDRIDPDEDAGALGDRLARLGGALLVETLDATEAGSVEATPQDEAGATYAPKLRPEDRIIGWSRPAEDVARLVRALAPAPAAATTFRGKVLKVFRVSRPPPAAPAAPDEAGQLFVAADRRLEVSTGDGRLRLEDVQPEGRRRMTGAEFARGYRPRAGERLGAEPPGEGAPRG